MSKWNLDAEWWPTDTIDAYHIRICGRVFHFNPGIAWYGRLYFWLKETWLVFIGKKK